MSEQLSFIEKQFPVSKVSKESFKERKANNGQTLTGLGKWWGRKPLILVRAAIMGCLLPATDNPAKDMEIFQKLLMLDREGLYRRKQKAIPASELYEMASNNKNLSRYVEDWFEEQGGKIKIAPDADKSEVEKKIFDSLGYDDKLKYCSRPEEMENLSIDAWNDINNYCGTSAKDIGEFVSQLSQKRYGHNITVGDCFAGGGSIPFEAARIGAKVCASDLNPISGLLTWADINLIGMDEGERKKIEKFQNTVWNEVEKEVEKLDIEKSENGDKAVSYIYCMEATCPECGKRIPLAPNWIIGRGTKSVVKLINCDDIYEFEIVQNASKEEMKSAERGTVDGNNMVCPFCGMRTPLSSVRHDILLDDGTTKSGVRVWDSEDFISADSDVYSERLYAIKYEGTDERGKKYRYYKAPSKREYDVEDKIITIVRENNKQWRQEEIIPSIMIESGYNTDQITREKGWKYWHQIFNPRQLLTLCVLSKAIRKHAKTKHELVAGLLGINRCMLFNSKLSMWVSSPGVEKPVWIFTNQAYNTMMNYGCCATSTLRNNWFFNLAQYRICGESSIDICDARQCDSVCDYWITDPPYADAVNYHELSEVSLAWDKYLLKQAFPTWYTDSKRVLAVRGDDSFSNTMIEIYSNLANHMPDNGMQVVMFTHSDPAVWAQLAIIMWKSGLKVTAAWNIATETEAVGLKSGNYVKGTVLLVLRKQTGDDIAFLDEINADIRNEVKSQIESMQKLDDKEEPNFADPDYVLAAYAASLKVLTSYASIEDLDLDYELNQAISNPTKSKVVTIIENAKKIAYDCVIPLEFDNFLWRELTNAEKFYIKGLESEKRGDYQIGTYQEFARGFSIGGYGQMMASEKANTARLKTPVEMAGRTIREVPDFERSVMRTVFQGIYVGIKEDNNPNKALGFIKSDMDNYWDKREMIQQILKFLLDIKYISNMQDHWGESAEMAELLLTLVAHDSI